MEQLKEIFNKIVKTSQQCLQQLYNFFETELEKTRSKDDKNLQFLADTSISTLQGPASFGHILLWTSAIFLVSALIWSYFAILDIVTVGEGKVIPSSQVQIIQNLEGGIISAIYVHEGDIVNKDQVLMKFDPTRFMSSYQEANAKALALKLKIERISALVDNKPFVPSRDLAGIRPDVIQSEKELYESRQKELQQIKDNKALAEKELAMTNPLVKEGAASQVEVIRLERNITDLQGQISGFYSKALSELNDARADLASLNDSMLELKDRLERTTVRSPVKGVVKQININTIGGVVQPGSDLMEIVPLDDTLLIEAKIKPSDVGFLHPGQQATVKITAYDYSIYGGLNGTLEQISADTITNEKGESFYHIRVRTAKNYLGTPEKPLYIIPGMTATTDILTGRESVLAYILKPILKTKENALHER